MHFGMLLFLAFSGEVTLPVHYSQPAPLRVIANVRSTKFCTAMHTMTLPLGYITRANLDNIATLAADTKRLYENEPSPDEARSVNTWSPVTAKISLRKVSYDTAQNLALADRIMNESWRRFPAGANSSVDGMRQRLQNIIDLQRALVNKYFQLTDGNRNCVGNSEQICSNLGAAPPPSVAALIDLDALTALDSAPDPEGQAAASAHDTARFGGAAQIEHQLNLQEAAFRQEFSEGARTCGI